VSPEDSTISKIKDKMEDVVEKIKPESPTEDEIKEEIWYDLSVLYYKYNDSIQKSAFREIFEDISKKIQSGDWTSIYRKLHRKKATDTTK
jgi:hypothetical protein